MYYLSPASFPCSVVCSFATASFGILQPFVSWRISHRSTRLSTTGLRSLGHYFSMDSWSSLAFVWAYLWRPCFSCRLIPLLPHLCYRIQFVSFLLSKFVLFSCQRAVLACLVCDSSGYPVIGLFSNSLVLCGFNSPAVTTEYWPSSLPTMYYFSYRMFDRNPHPI